MVAPLPPAASACLFSPFRILAYCPILFQFWAVRLGVAPITTALEILARIAALVPVGLSCAEAGDQVAEEILSYAVQELVLSVKAVVQRLQLAGKDGKGSFPIVIVGGVLEANKRWDIGGEVTNSIVEAYTGACLIRPKVEPAVGAALFAWNSATVETDSNVYCGTDSKRPQMTLYINMSKRMIYHQIM